MAETASWLKGFDQVVAAPNCSSSQLGEVFSPCSVHLCTSIFLTSHPKLQTKLKKTLCEEDYKLKSYNFPCTSRREFPSNSHMYFISLLLWTMLKITCNMKEKHDAISVTCSRSSYETIIPQNVQYRVIYSHAFKLGDTHLYSDFIPKPLRWGKGYVIHPT